MIPPETQISEYQSREALQVRVSLSRFITWLELAGVLVQDTTSEYEVIRYRAVDNDYHSFKAELEAGATVKKGKAIKTISSVIYRRKDGSLSWTGQALLHWNAFMAGRDMPKQPEIAPSKRGRSWTERTRERLLERDGNACYFCGKTMECDHEGRETKTGRPDITIEHLIGQHFARTEGLEVNHDENLVLAHAHCNRQIGHRPVTEKVTYREIMHNRETTMWSRPEITARPRTRRAGDPEVRMCGHPLGTTRWCPDCATKEK